MAFLLQKTFKLFVFWIWVFMMKIISETCRTYSYRYLRLLLTPFLFIEVPVPRLEGGWSCIYMLRVSMLLFFLVGFWDCSNVLYFLWCILLKCLYQSIRVSCIRVLMTVILYLPLIFLFYFVPTAWCFCFSFYCYS